MAGSSFMLAKVRNFNSDKTEFNECNPGKARSSV
jgi:hypothetical protein